MTKLFVSALALGVLVGGAASAQVAASFDNVVNTINENVSGKFSSLAVNIAEIDGSVDIESLGSTSSLATVNNNITDITLPLEVALVVGGTPIAIEGELSSLTDLSTSLTLGATTNSFGEVATLAAGAVNTTDTTLTETAADFASVADAYTSNTGASTSLTTALGSGIGVNTGALNTAGINGSVNANLSGGNNSFASISTTAAGAINTSNLTAAFVGTSTGAVQ